MALDTIVTQVSLDVYNHNQPEPTIKAIGSDSQTRYVQAFLFNDGLTYNPDSNSTATLTALRPDKTVVIGPAELVILIPSETTETLVPIEGTDEYEVVTETTPDIYGLQAEMTKEMLASPGHIVMQFKMVVGEQELRTSIFKVNNAVNIELSGSTVVDLTD